MTIALHSFRLLVAALHYNENSEREQARGSDGKPAFLVKYPKYKKGEYIIRAKKTTPTYGKLFENVLCDNVSVTLGDLFPFFSLFSTFCSLFLVLFSYC